LVRKSQRINCQVELNDSDLTHALPYEERVSLIIAAPGFVCFLLAIPRSASLIAT